MGQRTVDPRKVAIYIRWSTEDQGEGTTLDVQLEGCRHYALSQGWLVSDDLTFIDEGQSGASLDRPALGRLRAAVAAGAVDCVVVFKLDRLSRDVPDMVRLILEEWADRCDVKSAREPIDTTTQAGRMFFYTLASYAEWERSVIRERTFAGKLRRAREGHNPGFPPPYGYARGDRPGSFAIVPDEAAVVQRIFMAYQQGQGMRRIAAALNAEGVPFRGGRPWQGSTIRHILANPAYKGELVYGQTRRDLKRHRRTRAGAPHLVQAGVFPALVPPAEWAQVQVLRQGRPAPGRGGARSHASPHLLSGLLRCRRCGRALTGVSTGAGGRRYSYYACRGAACRGAAICDARRLPAADLDALVIAHLRALYGPAPARAACREQLLAAAAAGAAAARGALAAVAARLQKVAARQQKLRALLLEGQLTPAEYRRFAGDLAEEAQALGARRERLEREAGALAGAGALERRLNGLDDWGALTRVEQKQLLRTLIAGISAYRPPGGQAATCQITWRVGHCR